MPSGPDPLVVRQHERLTCRLPATVRVSDEYASQVTLARSAADAGGILNVKVVDCSRGGLGLESRLFLPRSCRVKITVAEAVQAVVAQAATGADVASPVGPLEFIARVQRITMTNRTPTYYLGLAFIGEGEEHTAKVARLLAAARADAPAETVPPSFKPDGPGRRAG